MRFHFGLISSFVLAYTVLAQSVEHSPHFGRAEQVTYDTYQAGIAISDVHNTFNRVIVSLVIPWITGAPGAGINIFAAIDGEICSQRSLRGGVQGYIDDDGHEVYRPYYRWAPDGEMTTFENITVSGGDVIKFQVVVMGYTSGSVTIANRNQSQTAYLQSSSSLCMVDAIWAVEPLYNLASYTFSPLANFDSITFKGAFAFGNTGLPIIAADGAVILNIQENNQNVTGVSIQGADVTVKNLYW